MCKWYDNIYIKGSVNGITKNASFNLEPGYYYMNDIANKLEVAFGFNKIKVVNYSTFEFHDVQSSSDYLNLTISNNYDVGTIVDSDDLNIHRQFTFIDNNDSQSLCYDEFKGFRQKTPGLTDTELRSLFETFDINDDGNIYLVNFLERIRDPLLAII